MSQLQEYTLHASSLSWLSARNLRWWSLAGGLSLGFSYPPYGVTILAWISLVPLFLSARYLSPRSAFLNAWIFYLGVFSVAFYWPLLHVRVDTAIVSAAAWLAFTMVFAVPTGCASWMTRRYRGISAVWSAGLLILLLEFIFRSGPVPMPWTSLGYSQASSGVVVRASFWIGSTGISTALVLTNACVAYGLLQEKGLRHRVFVVSISIPVLLVALGLTKPENKIVEQRNIAVIQPGFSPYEWSDIRDEGRVDRMIVLSDSVIRSSSRPFDLVVWPETTLPVPDSRSGNKALIARLTNWTETHSVSLLTGGITVEGESMSYGPPYRNSALLFEPGARPALGSKNILVPFAEFVPFSNKFSFLERFAVPAGGVSRYLPGKVPSVLPLTDFQVGVFICFESVFPKYAAALKNGGSDLFIVLTQNGWWRGSAGYRQHIMYDRFRAVEQGVALVQASVDGISGMITPDGITHDLTSIKTKATPVYDVPLYSSVTFYARFGDLWNWITLGIWFALLLFYGVHHKRGAVSLSPP
ncbi:MAG: apolipoprotein N-acyltransferase [Rhodothermia bacterium]|nr:MAG: apolipoprotein N-acyltransferase [Rhodothermia bacterium]